MRFTEVTKGPAAALAVTADETTAVATGTWVSTSRAGNAAVELAGSRAETHKVLGGALEVKEAEAEAEADIERHAGAVRNVPTVG